MGDTLKSPEIQEKDDYESDNHTNDAPDQDVTNIVPGHALSRFRCGPDDLFAMQFRHRTFAFLKEMDVPPLRHLLRTIVVAARLFQNLLALGQREPNVRFGSWPCKNALGGVQILAFAQ